VCDDEATHKKIWTKKTTYAGTPVRAVCKKKRSSERAANTTVSDDSFENSLCEGGDKKAAVPPETPKIAPQVLMSLLDWYKSI
jgi:hypothetical protein